MSLELIGRSNQFARKQYNDDGWEVDYLGEFLREEGDRWRNSPELTVEQKAELEFYLQNPDRARRIIPGDYYHRQFNKMDGDVYPWRTKFVFERLFHIFDLYPEY